MPTMEQAIEKLNQHWSYPAFRSYQQQVMEHTLAGRDVLFVAPTGYGKSVCFQIPPLLTGGCCLVISPLIALMHDQCVDCERHNVPAGYVNSFVNETEQEERYKNLIDGKYRVFYVSPERLNNTTFREVLERSQIDFLAVDEAHSVSVWGHAFRPAYLKIRQVFRWCKPRPQVLAFTATATGDIVDDIAKHLGMKDDCAKVIADPVRPNLRLTVEHDGSWRRLRQIVESWDLGKKGRYIIYAGTRKGAEVCAEIACDAHGDSAARAYHAGLKKEFREFVQTAFKKGTLPIVAATNAFGMGIDIPDIRAVVHMGISGSVEAYSQEFGRAGRDGLHSDCILLYDERSVDLQRRFIEWENPPYWAYKHVWEWLQANVPQGSILGMSGNSIAERIGPNVINGSQVNGCLSTMAAHGLVERNPLPYGTMVKADTKKLRGAAVGTVPLNGGPRRFAKWLWEECKKGLGKPMPDYVEYGLDRDTACEESGLTKNQIAHGISVLVDKQIIETQPADYGKTTKVLHYGVPLEDLLSEETVEKKRARDIERLERMIQYCSLPKGEYAQFLRTYFLEPNKLEALT